MESTNTSEWDILEASHFPSALLMICHCCAQDMGATAGSPGPGGGRGRFRLAPLRQMFRSSRGSTAGTGGSSGVQLPGPHVPLRGPSDLDEP